MTKTRFFHPDQLTALRQSCDWRRLLADLGVRADVRRCTESEFWGYSPFTPGERSASFHMKDPGLWYDWSSHATAPGRTKPGGGVIELVQAIHATRGHILKLNEAASWLLDHGYSRMDDAPAPKAPARESGGRGNAPISIDLTDRLTELGTHPAFVARGISAETCRILRCGYFAEKRGVLAQRLVFQVGGVGEAGGRVILSHMGRATTPEQEAAGKWRFYRGFNPSLELYHQDRLALDEDAARQVQDTGRVVLVEGAFDVAKCVEAGIHNVVASFGARLSAEQAGTLAAIAPRVIVFYDRDTAGAKGAEDATKRLREQGIEARAFDWNQAFTSPGRTPRPIPETLKDPCDFSTAQLRWMRGKGVV